MTLGRHLPVSAVLAIRRLMIEPGFPASRGVKNIVSLAMVLLVGVGALASTLYIRAWVMRHALLPLAADTSLRSYRASAGCQICRRNDLHSSSIGGGDACGLGLPPKVTVTVLRALQ